MSKKTIAQIDVAGKCVLTRVDFNVPIEHGKITDDRRIRMALPTIRSIVDRSGKAILMSHLGRPEGKGYEESESLKPCAARLSELLGKPVAFPSNDCTDAAAAAGVAGMKNGDVLLLDNLRFAKGEKKGDAAFAAKLAAYGDVYVNDAFGTAHREDASMYAVPMAMSVPPNKPRVAGLLMEKELKYLSAALQNPARPYVVVMGGAKVSDKIPMIHAVLEKADEILIGGAMAYTFLRAAGKKVGSSRVEEEMLPEATKILEEAMRLRCLLVLPQDHVCNTVFAHDSGAIKVFDGDIADGFMGLDIGPKTQTDYATRLRKAKTIVWNGPMGVFEWPPFAVGTMSVANAMVEATAKHGAVTIVGGGDSAAAAEQFGLAEKFSHVSTGGGASLEMLAGKPFRTVEILDEG